MVIGQIYAAVQSMAPVADAATDLLLDPIARQFIFLHTDQALKEYVGPSQADLKSVVAPAMCQRPMGRLVNGQLPLPEHRMGLQGTPYFMRTKMGPPCQGSRRCLHENRGTDCPRLRLQHRRRRMARNSRCLRCLRWAPPTDDFRQPRRH